jgi:hypothetical protein
MNTLCSFRPAEDGHSMAPDPTSTASDGETLFRYSDYDTPFWARNNRDSGRWHRVGDGATQYLSTTPNGAWAELARNENLRTEAELLQVRMPIWAVTLRQQGLADYSTFEKAEKAGFAPDALIDDDYDRCQTEGRRLRETGFMGVVAPSAALPEVVNVTIFGRRILSKWGVPTSLASSIPGCVVALGCPYPGLSERVRYRGEAHQGYQAYAVGAGAEQFLDDIEEGGTQVRRPDQEPPDDTTAPERK